MQSEIPGDRQYLRAVGGGIGAFRAAGIGAGAAPCDSAREGMLDRSFEGRVKVLQFIGNFGIGGTERQVVNLVERMDLGRFDVRMGCFRRSGEFMPRVQARRIPIEEYRINSFYNVRALREQARAASYLRSHGVHIVHSYGFYQNVFAIPAARLAGVPVVIASIRDTGEMLTRLQKCALRAFCRMADCILANAEGVRQWLIQEGYMPEKIQVIRNGIVVPPRSPRIREGGLRAELGLPAGTPLVAVVSRLNPKKGVDYFLEAASKVRVLFPHARFVVIGGGESQTKLQRDVAAMGLDGLVFFTGFRTDVQQLLPQIDVSVLPSLSEGLSNSVLESMASGTAVIATDVGGTSEAVVDGHTGLLVKPADGDALARAMCLLLGNLDLVETFGEAGRRRVEQVFSVENMVRQTEALYAALMDSRDSARTGIWRA